MSRGIIAIVLFLALTVVSFFLGMAITGRVSRAYKVSSPDFNLEIGGVSRSVSEWAAAYQPTILNAPDHAPPAPIAMWYEVSQADRQTVAFIYHSMWEDEYHNPITATDVLYRWYRAVVYGSPRDIEYVEIFVDPASGTIVRVRFETAAVGDYQRTITEHLYAFLNRANGSLVYHVEDSSGNIITPDTPRPDLGWSTEHPVALFVSTWNHLYSLDSPGSQYLPLNMPLKYLDDQSYKDYKFATRSQGDIATQTDQRGRYAVVAILWLALVATSFVFLFRSVRR